MPTKTTPAKQRDPDSPSFWLTRIDPKFDLFSSIDDYRCALQKERRDKNHHVRLLRKAGLADEARSLQRCDGADKSCGRGDCPVCKLEHDRALNAEFLQLLAAYDNHGLSLVITFEVGDLFSPDLQSDTVIRSCHERLRTKLNNAGYTGSRILGGFNLVASEQNIWWCEMPLVIFGATHGQIGNLSDKLRPFRIEEAGWLGHGEIDIDFITANTLAHYTNKPVPDDLFGDGLESPTPVQLFHLRWFSTMRLENCTFHYGLDEADVAPAA